MSSKHTFCVYCQVRRIWPFHTVSTFMFCQAGMRLLSKDPSVFCANQEVFIQICRQSLCQWVCFHLCVFFLISVREKPIYNASQTRILEQIWMEFTRSKLRYSLNNPCSQMRGHDIQRAGFSTKPPWWIVHTCATRRVCPESSWAAGSGGGGGWGRWMLQAFMHITQNSSNSESPALKPTW